MFLKKLFKRVRNRKITLFSRQRWYWLKLDAATFPNDVAVRFYCSSGYLNQHLFLQTVFDCSSFCFLRHFFNCNWNQSSLKCNVEYFCSAEFLMVKCFPYMALSNTGCFWLMLSGVRKKIAVFWTIIQDFPLFKVKSAFSTLLVALAVSSSAWKIIGIHFLGYSFAKKIQDFWLVENLLRDFCFETDE